VEALAAVTVIYMMLCTLAAGLGHLLSLRLSRHMTARRGLRPMLTSE
jgi:hypothetical protein